MNFPEIAGYLAATLTTLSFIPQVVKIWRRKKADDISIPAFSAFFIGVLLWVYYGVGAGAWPIILANGITAILAAGVLILTIRYRK